MNGSADQKIQAACFSRVFVHAGGAMRRSRCAGLSGLAAAAVFAAANLNASPLYLAILSGQAASDAVWQAVAETLAERHGGEIIIYAGSAFPEAFWLELSVRRLSYVFVRNIA